MSAADSAAFPWAIVVSGIVGIAGIAGTLFSGHFANRAAEKRRLAEQQHEDRTRFHKERVEVYARFIAAYKAYRGLVYKKRYPPVVQENDTLAMLNPFTLSPPHPEEVRQARAAFSEVREALILIAFKEVADVADRVFGAATTLDNDKMTAEKVEEWDQIALKALAEFRKAARAELLPP